TAKERTAEWIDDKWMTFEKNWIDKGAWLSRYEKEAIAKADPDSPLKSRPYQFWMHFNKQQYALSAIRHGVIEWDEQGNARRTGPGLEEAWKPLKDDHDSKGFLLYNLALQTVEGSTKERPYETGMPLADARQVISEVEADKETHARYQEVQTKWTAH